MNLCARFMVGVRALLAKRGVRMGSTGVSYPSFGLRSVVGPDRYFPPPSEKISGWLARLVRTLEQFFPHTSAPEEYKLNQDIDTYVENRLEQSCDRRPSTAWRRSSWSGNGFHSNELYSSKILMRMRIKCYSKPFTQLQLQNFQHPAPKL